MAVSLKSLIHLAPFPEEQKKVFIENIDKLTEDEKYELSKTAWSGLAVIFYGRLQTERNSLMEEAILQKKDFNQNDLQEIEARILYEFAQKLQLGENQESIAEVKKELEVYKTKPLATDVNSSPPPARNS